jgi:hypothetical protein
MRMKRSLAALALAGVLAITGCRAEVEDRNKDGIPEDVDVSVDDSARIDLPDVDVSTDTQTIRVPDIDVTPDSN